MFFLNSLTQPGVQRINCCNYFLCFNYYFSFFVLNICIVSLLHIERGNILKYSEVGANQFPLFHWQSSPFCWCMHSFPEPCLAFPFHWYTKIPSQPKTLKGDGGFHQIWAPSPLVLSISCAIDPEIWNQFNAVKELFKMMPGSALKLYMICFKYLCTLFFFNTWRPFWFHGIY